jgi:hypothetical protein
MRYSATYLDQNNSEGPTIDSKTSQKLKPKSRTWRAHSSHLQQAGFLVFFHVTLTFQAATGSQEHVLELLVVNRVVPKRQPRHGVFMPYLFPSKSTNNTHPLAVITNHTRISRDQLIKSSTNESS